MAAKDLQEMIEIIQKEPRWLKRDGTPYRVNRLDLNDSEWDEAMREVERDLTDRNYKQVALTKTWWGAKISTVWLGLNFNMWPGGRPLIFETLVFVRGSGGYMQRYSTETEAFQGHKDIVEMYKNPWRFIWEKLEWIDTGLVFTRYWESLFVSKKTRRIVKSRKV